MRRVICILACASLSLLSACSRKGSPDVIVTLSSCLDDLTNVAAFARSSPGRTEMISTFDRTGGNKDWRSWRDTDCAADGLVDMAVLQGPGCVTRIWMTNVPAKEWLFFFDGEKSPRIITSTAELFGGKAPFLPPLCDRVSGGYYCYLPMPYAESLRIAVVPTGFQPNHMPYFHVNYSTYPVGTAVETFPLEFDSARLAEVRAVGASWEKTAVHHRQALSSTMGQQTLVIGPGEKVPWLEEEGPGTLTTLGIRLVFSDECSSGERARALRDLVLRIAWDGNSEMSVDAPLGDFFCNAFYGRAFSAMPLGFVDGTYCCLFPMPFEKAARGWLRNDGTQEISVEVQYAVTHTLLRNAPYFHARWRSSMNGQRPFGVLDVSGEGHFVGCYLNSVGTDGTWNILEGDESIFVDGEDVPSWHGTGLEDYFNGAWYYTGIFDLPLHGLVEKAPIRTGQYRFHLLDRVPFQKRFKLEFEFGHGNAARGYMSSTAYWYQSKPVAAASKIPQGRSARLPPQDPLARMAVMGRVFELERIGHFQEAADRCEIFAEEFATAYPDAAETARLRATAYREQLNGFNSVKGIYEDISRRRPSSITGRQAALLLWFHSAPTNAILGVHPNGKSRVFLNGKEVLSADDPVNLHIKPLSLAPGQHILTAEITPTRQDAWFSACLRTHDGDVVTGSSWEKRRDRPPAWPMSGLNEVGWEPMGIQSTSDMLPRMNFWQFSPNAFIMMQSHRMQLLRPWRTWGAGQAGKTAWLRKTFEVSDVVGENR